MVTHPSARQTLKPPPLESGDRLSRIEFERSYAADPQAKKAELIEGVVFVASPLRFNPHNDICTIFVGTRG